MTLDLVSFLNGGQVWTYWLQDRKQGANKAVNEQISVIRFLWVLFDERLTWRQRVDKGQVWKGQQSLKLPGSMRPGSNCSNIVKCTTDRHGSLEKVRVSVLWEMTHKGQNKVVTCTLTFYSYAISSLNNANLKSVAQHNLVRSSLQVLILISSSVISVYLINDCIANNQKVMMMLIYSRDYTKDW